jgi:hypothetical protein
MLVVIDPATVSMLTALTTTGKPLHAPIMKLFQNNYTPVHGTTLSNLTEATFVGYVASSAITFGTAYLNSQGYAEIDGPTTQFTCTASTTPNTIYGYWVEDGSGNLLYAERFTAPQYITGSGQAVVVVPRFTLGSQQT